MATDADRLEVANFLRLSAHPRPQTYGERMRSVAPQEALIVSLSGFSEHEGTDRRET
jgi:hypothetical protein